MLILVIGEAGSGKTFFTEQKLFPYVGSHHVEIIRDPLPGRLKVSDIADKMQNEAVLVIEAATDKDIHPELRERAEYLVFMTPSALGAYFDRCSNDVGYLRDKRIFAALKAVCGVDHTPVIFDPNAKRFIVHYD